MLNYANLGLRISRLYSEENEIKYFHLICGVCIDLGSNFCIVITRTQGGQLHASKKVIHTSRKNYTFIRIFMLKN